MVRQYRWVKLPVETYQLYKNIQGQMIKDINLWKGKPVSIPMTKVFHAVASPKFNENYIQVDLNNLLRFAKKRK